MTRDSDVVDRKLTPGPTARVVGYARPFLRPIIVFLVSWWSTPSSWWRSRCCSRTSSTTV
jgi:hypothetical protein